MTGTCLALDRVASLIFSDLWHDGQIQEPDPLAGKNPAALKRGKARGAKGGKARALN